MKRIIDISEEEYKFIKDLQFYSSGRRNGKTIEKHVINAIQNSIPYNPSGDLISREALRKEVTEKVHFMTVDGHIAYDKMLKLIDSAPPVPDRLQGEWKETDFPESTFCGCSVCGFDLGAYSFNFCPNCGADMRFTEG